VAWKIKEASMKYLVSLIIILLFPLSLLAQSRDTDKTERVEERSHALEQDYDWKVEDNIGTVMAIDGDSIMYEEQWMIPAPTGLVITGENADETIGLAMLEAPFRAQVTYYRKGKYIYIEKLQFLEQYKYDSEDNIIEEK
jgi:hypothetical protein